MIWLLVALGFPLGLFLYGRFNLAATAAEWEEATSPATQRMLDDVALEVQTDGPLAAGMLAQGRKERRRARFHEATRLLRLASDNIARATPRRMERLRAMSRLVRMASAVMPPAPVSPTRFKLATVVFLTGAAVPVHHFLVTGAERLALRIHVVLLGLWFAAAALRRSATLGTAQPVDETPWNDAGVALDDWRGLDEEHYVALRSLMAGLTAVPRPEAVAAALEAKR